MGIVSSLESGLEAVESAAGNALTATGTYIAGLGAKLAPVAEEIEQAVEGDVVKAAETAAPVVEAAAATVIGQEAGALAGAAAAAVTAAV